MGTSPAMGATLRWVLVAVLLAAACEPAASPRQSPAPRPRPTGAAARLVGLVATMSGPGARAGEDAFEGAQLAVHHLNREAGRFELVTLDAGGDAGAALRLVERLAADPRVAGIVYAGPPEVLPRAEDALASAEIPAVAVSGDLHAAGALTPHLFQTAPSVVWEARRIARYLLEDRGYRQVGLVAAAGWEGRAAREALRIELARAGGRLAAVAAVGPRGRGMGAALARMRRARAEAVVLFVRPGTFARACRLLRARGAGYRGTDRARLASAPPPLRRRRLRAGWWRPQPVGFAAAVGPASGRAAPPGAVAAESLGRAAGALPLPALQRFAAAFRAWWGYEPDGRELPAYDAARMVGWAATRGGEDLARTLEDLRGVAFGGPALTFGRGDHAAVDGPVVGLWTVPGPGEPRPLPGLGWLPLARGFSTDGRRTDLPPRYWPHLFRGARGSRPPRVTAMRAALATDRSDPLR